MQAMTYGKAISAQKCKSASKIKRALVYIIIQSTIGMIRRCVLVRNNCRYIFTVNNPNSAAVIGKMVKPEQMSAINNTIQKGMKVSIKKE